MCQGFEFEKSCFQHCYLLKEEDPPQCIACDCHLTVKHVLFDCVDFIESRNRHFNVNSFKELFEKVPFIFLTRDWSVLLIVKPFKNL